MINRKTNLIEEVQRDFASRREARRALEAKWLLNLNFMQGNQHSVLDSKLDIVDYGKRYLWQEREVYNHIAPIIESRLAKFTRVNCSVVVRPASGEEEDVESARLATKLLEATFQDNDFYKLNGQANFWAELTGTVFYKVMWDGEGEGGVRIVVCPSYEIYPDSLSSTSVKDCASVIHARAYPVSYVKDVWGAEVKGEEVSVIEADSFSTGGGKYPSSAFKAERESKKDYCVVIERYERPSADYPEGRLVIVCGDKLLYEGVLPYVNGENGKRGYPFVRQVAFESPCGFYGSSVIERLIPVQRAYNAVKNRKHEFLSRLSVGVLAAEEGSVDLDSLEEEGLAPGRVITYRQGSTPPMLMSPGTVPGEFRDEEDRLLQEFRTVSGISDAVQLSSSAQSSISGYALSLLIEQDYNRLSVTTESIRSAVKEVARMILRLFRTEGASKRMIRISGDNGAVEIKAFKASSLKGEDVVMESDSTMVETPATRKSMILELLNYGLLGDENGVISNRNRAKIVEMLGFGNWEGARNDDEIHLKKASLENADMELEKEQAADELDDHGLHIAEHVAALVGRNKRLSERAKKLMHQHVRRHKVLQSLSLKSEKI